MLSQGNSGTGMTLFSPDDIIFHECQSNHTQTTINFHPKLQTSAHTDSEETETELLSGSKELDDGEIVEIRKHHFNRVSGKMTLYLQIRFSNKPQLLWHPIILVKQDAPNL
eukprot:4126737-Ditylum_brightwellii.AAC.1